MPFIVFLWQYFSLIYFCLCGSNNHNFPNLIWFLVQWSLTASLLNTIYIHHTHLNVAHIMPKAIHFGFSWLCFHFFLLLFMTKQKLFDGGNFITAAANNTWIIFHFPRCELWMVESKIIIIQIKSNFCSSMREIVIFSIIFCFIWSKIIWIKRKISHLFQFNMIINVHNQLNKSWISLSIACGNCVMFKRQLNNEKKLLYFDEKVRKKIIKLK